MGVELAVVDAVGDNVLVKEEIEDLVAVPEANDALESDDFDFITVAVGEIDTVPVVEGVVEA